MEPKMKKVAFALSIILMNLVFIAEPVAKLFGVSSLVITAVVWLAWIVFACVYRIKVWRQLKRESQAIEEKYEAKMKQLMAESSAAIKSH